MWNLKKEFIRKGLHITLVLIILFVYLFLQKRYTPKFALAIVVLILICFIGLEYFRIEHGVKIPVFHFVWRDVEKDHFGGEIFLLIAIIISLSIFGMGIVIPALIVSTAGDITASIVGQKYSKKWIPRLNGKSYEAALAQLIVCFVIGFVMLKSFWVVLVLGLVVTVLETVTSKVSDNLVVPLAASLMLYFLTTL